MNPLFGYLTMSVALLGASVPALDDEGLRQVLEGRLNGDRTGACFAAAIIDDTVTKAVVCADSSKKSGIDAETAFEIGSISKTMTAALVAQKILDGKMSLDDPISKWMPKDVTVPVFGDQPILLRHLLTHSSGLPALPPRLQMTNPEDPYASLTSAQLYGSLADVQLAHAPGTQFAYSNFAMMLASDIIARQSGGTLETLLRERLFAPLGMNHSYIAQAPKGVRVAQGHTQTGKKTAAWHIPVDMAGVGGVRASLNDMVRYAQAEMGSRPSRLDAAIALTQKELVNLSGTRVGMNWMMMQRGDRELLAHEGGTGGFSSLILLDAQAKRGVVILSDTALTAVGGLGRLGLHLLDGSMPPEPPRRLMDATPEVLKALVGSYVLDGGLKMEVRERKGNLFIQASGQPEFKMGHDSAGDFFPLDFDAVLRPQQQGDGRYAFTWFQGGGAMSATRVAADADSTSETPAAIDVDADALKHYIGSYPLMPGFDLAVIADEGVLYIQGTGQPRIAVRAVQKDVFVAESVGARIVFERDAEASVIALVLHQGGQQLRGLRQ